MPSRDQESAAIGPLDAVPASQMVEVHTYERCPHSGPHAPPVRSFEFRYKVPQGKFYGRVINLWVGGEKPDKVKRLVDIEPTDFIISHTKFQIAVLECTHPDPKSWIERNLDYEPVCMDAENNRNVMFRFRNREDHLLFHIAFAQYAA